MHNYGKKKSRDTKAGMDGKTEPEVFLFSLFLLINSNQKLLSTRKTRVSVFPASG